MHEAVKLVAKRSLMGDIELGVAAVTSPAVIEGYLCLWWSTLGRKVGKRGWACWVRFCPLKWLHCARGYQACGEEISNGLYRAGACCCDFNSGNRRTLALVAVITRLSVEQEIATLDGCDFAR
jgi:hypothetical protein